MGWRGDWTDVLFVLVRTTDSMPAWRGRRSPRRYLLSSRLRCGLCGAVLKPARRKNRQGEYQRRYWCHKLPGVAGCGRISIQAEPVEAFITDAVLWRLDSPELADALTGRAAADEPRTQPPTAVPQARSPVRPHRLHDQPRPGRRLHHEPRHAHVVQAPVTAQHQDVAAQVSQPRPVHVPQARRQHRRPLIARQALRHPVLIHVERVTRPAPRPRSARPPTDPPPIASLNSDAVNRNTINDTGPPASAGIRSPSTDPHPARPSLGPPAAVSPTSVIPRFPPWRVVPAAGRGPPPPVPPI